ncbi:MAG: alpha/beta hydrolase [Desulfobulbaceae bacterium]|nr:alpha/beta hydrolase [Desulfobulbaceae bacterium]
MVHLFGTLLAMAGLLYALLCLYLFFLQEKLLFYPNLPGRELRASPADIGLDYESVAITTGDNIRLHGWFIRAREEKGTLLFFHGNAGNISHRLDSIRIFTSLGLSVLIIDYRGYGQSQGKISEKGTYLDAEAAWRYLTEEKKIVPQEIILFGRSLGGAIAAVLAAKHPPGGLILESVFTSVPEMAARYYPVFPVRLLARFRYDTRTALASVFCPVLIIHSPDDEIIPFENGRILFETAREPKFFLEIRGSHNEGFVASGPLYQQGLQDFVNEILAEQK